MRNTIFSKSLASTVALLFSSAVMALSSCGSEMSDSGAGTDSNTHFLEECESDADCGGLACECGLCTERCSQDAACQALSKDAFCAASDGCSVSICLDETGSFRMNGSAPPASTDAAHATPDGGANPEAKTLPEANPFKEATETCKQLACVSTTVRPEAIPDGGLLPLTCHFDVPLPPEGENYGGVMVHITLANGSDPFIPFVEAQPACGAVDPGWYYAEVPWGVQIALCPQTCADAERGFEAQFICLPLPETAACPLLGPPPNL